MLAVSTSKSEERSSNLRKGTAGSIQHYVVNGSGSSRHERLVELVGRRVRCDNADCRERPREAHARPTGSNRAQHQQAKDEIFGDVPAFSDEVVSESDSVGSQAREEPMQKRLDDRLGIVRREPTRGECENDCGPDDNRRPTAEWRHQQLSAQWYADAWLERGRFASRYSTIPAGNSALRG
jgi:hypothetical protein